VAAVIHLAGESILGIWTPAKKRRIMESRARGTSLIAEAIAGLRAPPRILVSASGVGYYGDAGETTLTEASPAGTDFLARVCQAWELATQPAADAGVRVVHLRFGLVLHPAGGVLALAMPVFRLGLGARLGNGRQWMSWIARSDLVRVIQLALDDDRLEGAVNAVAPGAVRNEDFTRILAESVRRPAILAIPAFALRALTGGMADALLLPSQRAIPSVLTEFGFRFERPLVGDAIGKGLD
jgi:uncharacterized protein (TIGR01777 family)